MTDKQLAVFVRMVNTMYINTVDKFLLSLPDSTLEVLARKSEPEGESPLATLTEFRQILDVMEATLHRDAGAEEDLEALLARAQPEAGPGYLAELLRKAGGVAGGLMVAGGILLLTLPLSGCASPSARGPFRTITYPSGFQLVTDQRVLPLPVGASVRCSASLPAGAVESRFLPGWTFPDGANGPHGANGN